MHFNVSQLMMEPSGSTRAYEVDEDVTLAHEDNVKRVSGAVKLLRTDRGVWLSARLDSEAVCSCSRCLEEFRQPVQMSIEEECFSGEETGVADEGAGTNVVAVGEERATIDRQHILDLDEAIRQYFTLSTPMKPVCRDDCRGICTNCGTDLNESSCRCDETLVDPRWGPLQELAATRPTD